MTLDRFGKPIRISFAPHEIIWVEAVLDLPSRERLAAFSDIADMTGRSAAQVRDFAYKHDARRRAAQRVAPCSIAVPVRTLAPSTIAVSPERLRGGR